MMTLSMWTPDSVNSDTLKLFFNFTELFRHQSFSYGQSSVGPSPGHPEAEGSSEVHTETGPAPNTRGGSHRSETVLIIWCTSCVHSQEESEENLVSRAGDGRISLRLSAHSTPHRSKKNSVAAKKRPVAKISNLFGLIDTEKLSSLLGKYFLPTSLVVLDS